MSRPLPSSVVGKRKALATLFRALDAHTSNDKGRPSRLHNVCVRPVDVADAPPVIRFEATDGYALMRVDVPRSWFTFDGDDGVVADLTPPTGIYAAKDAAARLAIGVAPEPLPADEYDVTFWPPTDQIVPAETMAPGASCKFNPVLLGGVLDTIAKIASAFDGTKTDGVRVQLGQGSVDPCRLTRKVFLDAGRVGFHDAVDVVGVVMPMRI
jgi:hypothetical protein